MMKQTTYRVWTFYEQNDYGTLVKYVILNKATKKIHSSWHDWAEAVKTCRDLNALEALIVADSKKAGN